MAITIKYTKAQYQAKVTELEGYYNMLSQHLTKMQDLKSKMFEFWDDENARMAGQVLAIKIRSVENTMDITNDSIIFYKSAIDKLDGASLSVGDLLGDALSVLGVLGE